MINIIGYVGNHGQITKSVRAGNCAASWVDIRKQGSNAVFGDGHFEICE